MIMVKKIVLAASAAAVVLGAGTAALATSGGSAASPAASSPAASKPAAKPSTSAKPDGQGRAGAPGQLKAQGAQGRGKGHRPELRALGRALHAQWVTRDRDDANAFVTHNAIRGAVTAVSATSITVKAADGVSQTYAVTGTTKVHLRKGQPANGNAANGNAGTISDVHTGDKVAVTGTGTTSLTAQHIVDATD
jgi:hypothetical protein